MDMFGVVTKTLAFGALLLGSAVAAQAAPVAAAFEATYAAIGTQTTVPFGWVDFCQRYKGECDHARAEPVDINLSAKALSEIDRVNKPFLPIAAGLSLREVARTNDVSYETARSHLKNIYSKLGVNSQVGLVRRLMP